jgi:hypothetical protein
MQEEVWYIGEEVRRREKTRGDWCVAGGVKNGSKNNRRA